MKTTTFIRFTLAISVALFLQIACDDGGGELSSEPAVEGYQPESPASPAVSDSPSAAASASAAAAAPTPVGEPRAVTETLAITGEHLFSVDTSTPEFPLVLHGTEGHRLVGRLADEDGRRSIVLVNSRTGAEEVVFEADWLLPAVGAVNGKGTMVVCVNRLAGSPSELTGGQMPDPSQGVDLQCKTYLRKASRWSKERILFRARKALWLYDVTANRRGGFTVAYAADSSGLLVDDPAAGDGMYRVEFKHGRFGAAVLADKFHVPDMR